MLFKLEDRLKEAKSITGSVDLDISLRLKKLYLEGYTPIRSKLSPESIKGFEQFYFTSMQRYSLETQEAVIEEIKEKVAKDPDFYNFAYLNTMIGNRNSIKSIPSTRFGFRDDNQRMENESFVLKHFYSHYFDRMPSLN